MTNQTLVPGGEVTGWEQTVYAFLAEKERRSGSMRTVQAYSRMVFQFFGTLGKTPDEVTSPDVFSYAHSIGLSGKKPSSVTIAARIACLSSFYRFLIRMSLVISNPCDKLERPRATPAPPRGLAATDIQKLLAVIPNTPVGLRDRAIVLTLTLTGRRRTEVLSLTAVNLSNEGDAVYYTYRGKGGKQGKRELPQPAHRAIQASLAAFGKQFSQHAASGVPVAFQWRLWPGYQQRHFLRQPAPLLKSRWTTSVWRPHLQALGSQAPTGRWRVGGGGQPIP